MAAGSVGTPWGRDARRGFLTGVVLFAVGLVAVTIGTSSGEAGAVAVAAIAVVAGLTGLAVRYRRTRSARALIPAAVGAALVLLIVVLGRASTPGVLAAVVTATAVGLLTGRRTASSPEP